MIPFFWFLSAHGIQFQSALPPYHFFVSFPYSHPPISTSVQTSFIVCLAYIYLVPISSSWTYEIISIFFWFNLLLLTSHCLRYYNQNLLVWHTRSSMIEAVHHFNTDYKTLPYLIVWSWYGLNICAPPEFIFWNPNLQCNGIRKWDLCVTS